MTHFQGLLQRLTVVRDIHDPQKLPNALVGGYIAGFDGYLTLPLVD